MGKKKSDFLLYPYDRVTLISEKTSAESPASSVSKKYLLYTSKLA